MIEVDLDVLGQEERPYFAARFRNDRVEIEGTPQCTLGRKLPGPTPDQPDGVFAEWRWDGELLKVRNDHYGMSPLFYSCYGNEIRISPCIMKVLEGNAPRDLDYAAFAVLLWMGHCVGDDTPFQHVRVLPPDSTLTWTQGELQLESPPLPIHREIDATLSFDDAVDRFTELFDLAIGKRLPDDHDVVLPLSGGRDSRHILFALDAHGVRPRSCVTLKYRPPATNEDTRIARLIANEMGIGHVVIEKASSWLQAVVKEVPLSNFCGGSHAWVLPLAAYLKDRTSTLYDGLAGDVLSGGFLADERKTALYRQGRFDDLAAILLTEGGRGGFNKTALARPFRDKVPFSTAVERMVQELKRHAEASNPMLSFLFWNRTRCGVSQIPLSIMSHVPVVHCPYLDREVYDFITGVDPLYLLGNRLHDAAIHRTYPQFAHLPFENKAKTALYRPEDHAYFRKALKELLAYLVYQGFKSSELVRKQAVYPRLISEMLKQRPRSPWYLTSTVYCLEIERIWDGEG